MAVFNAEWDRPVSLDDMAKELTAVNIQVLSSEKRVVPGFIIALCGAPTGIANVYGIAKDDLPRIPADQQGVKRFQSWVYDSPSIEVAKYDGSLQCDLEKVRALGFVLYLEGISIARARAGSHVARRS